MSAPNAGRQSPDPEHQTGAQQSDTPAGAGKVDKSDSKNEGKDDQLGGLSSNPKHILEDSAKEKTGKTVGHYGENETPKNPEKAP